jgi:hypothetical protein
MTSNLPTPGSVWLHKKTARLMRAVLVDSTEIIAHNCELAARTPGLPMASWSGTPDQFARAFIQQSPDLYPATAN